MAYGMVNVPGVPWDKVKNIDVPDEGSVAVGAGAEAAADLDGGSVAIGKDANAKSGGGVAVGQEANASSYGAAVGLLANCDSSGGAVGFQAKASSGGAVGCQSSADKGGAVGYGAVGENGFAGGHDAKVASGIDAVQLGMGTNQTEKTLQVYDYQLLDAKGKIPGERLKNIEVTDDGYVKVGTGTFAAYGDGAIAIGKGASADDSIAIGAGASATVGVAVGQDAYVATGGIAIGDNARSNVPDAIQLGYGTNASENTLQVYDYQLLDASGKIPPERIGQKGTWTPAIISSTTSRPTITYNRQEGDYIRIGDMVWCFFTIWLKSVSKGSASGNIVLGGLPFAPYGGDLGKVVDNKTYVAYLNAASGAVGYEFLMSETGGVALIKRAAGGNTYCTWASDSGILNNNTEFAGIVCYHI